MWLNDALRATRWQAKFFFRLPCTESRLLFSNSAILSEFADLPSVNLTQVYLKSIYKFSKSKEMFKKFVKPVPISINFNHHLIFIFYRFDEKENISGFQQLKTSVQKGIRSKIIEQYPYIDTCINDVLPKKEPFRLMKWFVNLLGFIYFLNISS